MEIHIARDGQQFGPFSPDEVRRQLAAGTLLATDYAWSEGATDWVALGRLPMLMPPSVTSGAPSLSSHAGTIPIAPVAYRTPATSGLAIASLVLGISSLTFLLGIGGVAGIVCGHLARSGIRRSEGTLSGDGMAVAGLITSYIGMFITLLIFVFAIALIGAGLALPLFHFFGEADLESKLTPSLNQARQIAAACQSFAADHHDAFPKKLDELVPKYLPDRQIFVCPLSGPAISMGYQYLGGTAKDPAEKILFMSKYQSLQGQRIVVRVDGSAAFEKPPPELLPPGGR